MELTSLQSDFLLPSAGFLVVQAEGKQVLGLGESNIILLFYNWSLRINSFKSGGGVVCEYLEDYLGISSIFSGEI